MTDKKNKMQQPVRITLAMALWALILWFLTLGQPTLVPLAKGVFIIFVIPMGLVEWLKYKGIVGENRSVMVKIIAILGAALLWYFSYR